MELLYEERNIGVGIDGAFQYRKSFRPEFSFNPTQNLSGLLTVRSRGEDEG